MALRLFLAMWIFLSLLFGVRSSWAQAELGGVGSLGNFGVGLEAGFGGGETMPGAILVKIQGTVQCTDCALEEMGVEETPGDLYQLSYENTHFVVKVSNAAPDIAWEMVERHKLFLQPGEDANQLKRLLDGNAPGRVIDVTAGVAPSQGNLIPLVVKVK
jgi:hypothetical protein